jgi:hypothetical protein
MLGVVKLNAVASKVAAPWWQRNTDNVILRLPSITLVTVFQPFIIFDSKENQNKTFKNKFFSLPPNLGSSHTLKFVRKTCDRICWTP